MLIVKNYKRKWKWNYNMLILKDYSRNWDGNEIYTKLVDTGRGYVVKSFFNNTVTSEYNYNYNEKKKAEQKFEEVK